MWVGKVTFSPLAATTVENALDQGTELPAARSADLPVFRSSACSEPAECKAAVKELCVNTGSDETASCVLQLQPLPLPFVFTPAN